MDSGSDGRIDRRRFEIRNSKSESKLKSAIQSPKARREGGKRKSTVVISVVVLAIVGLMALGFVYRGEIQQEWYLSRMESETGEGRREAAEALLALNPGRAVPRLLKWSSAEIERIMDTRPEPFEPPAEVSWMLERGAEIVPPLIGVLRNSRRSRGIRRAAMYTLSIVGEPAVSSLVDVLEHEEPQVRTYAVGALTHMFFLRQDLFAETESLRRIDEETTHSVGSVLAKRLTDESDELRWYCLRNLGRVRDWIPEILPAFFERLEDPRRPNREAAIESLDWALHRAESDRVVRIGLRERGQALTGILEKVREHEDERVRSLAEQALRLLEPEDPSESK